MHQRDQGQCRVGIFASRRIHTVAGYYLGVFIKTLQSRTLHRCFFGTDMPPSPWRPA